MKRLSHKIKDYKVKYLVDDMKEWWYDFYVYKAYEYITSILPTRLKRSAQYFVFGWYNRDFDVFYVDQLVLFKLKRLEHLFINEGHHWEGCENYKPKMKSLKLAIKLLTKYCNEDKIYMFLDAHDRKWGEPISTTKLIEGSENKPGGPYYGWETSRPNANTDEEKEQESKEFVAASGADERRHEKLRANAYKIIIKYGHYWWD